MEDIYLMTDTADILAFGSHPDDVEMTCAGLLLKLGARGYTTAAVHLTRGEMGSRGTVEERRAEAEEAARIMRVDWMEMLDLGDSRMKVDRESVDTVAALIRRARPRLVLAPYSRDPHPDHARSGRLVAEAFHVAGLKKYPLEGEPWNPGQLAYCMYRAHFRPSFVVDVTEQFEEKRAAVLAYHSQVGATKSGEEESRLSSPLFLRAWEGRHLHFGATIGVLYGEAYYTEYAIPLEDPAAVFAIPQQRRIAVEGPA